MIHFPMNLTRQHGFQNEGPEEGNPRKILMLKKYGET